MKFIFHCYWIALLLSANCYGQQKNNLESLMEGAPIACGGSNKTLERKIIEGGIAKFIRGAEGKYSYEKEDFKNYIFEESMKNNDPSTERKLKLYSDCILNYLDRVLGRARGEIGILEHQLGSFQVKLDYCSRRGGTATCILSVRSDASGDNVWVSGKTALISNSGEMFGGRFFRFGSDKIQFSDGNAWRSQMIARHILRDISYSLQIDFPVVPQQAEIQALALHLGRGLADNRPLDFRPVQWR